MAIVVEGFDNSGKSTLAAELGLDVAHAGPRPKSFREEQSCLEGQRQQARLPVVLDRVTCISQPAYSGASDRIYTYYQDLMVETHHCVLVYCRPKIETIAKFKDHVAKSYDTPQHLQWLMANYRNVIDRYDRIFKRLPHIVYDWENPDKSILQEAWNAQFSIGGWKKCLSLIQK